MDKLQLAEFLKTLDKEIEVKEGKQYIEVTVLPSLLHSFAQSLKENEATSFDFLFCLTGVDYGNDLGVIYHLRSTKHGHTLVLKTRVSDRESPQIDSGVDLWSTADLNV
jgi:NADH:ubiquinone oxidoreductase subunit C